MPQCVTDVLPTNRPSSSETAQHYIYKSNLLISNPVKAEARLKAVISNIPFGSYMCLSVCLFVLSRFSLPLCLSCPSIHQSACYRLSLFSTCLPAASSSSAASLSNDCPSNPSIHTAASERNEATPQPTEQPTVHRSQQMTAAREETIEDIKMECTCQEPVVSLLSRLYSSSGVATLHEAICVALHSFMLECGFQCPSSHGVSFY